MKSYRYARAKNEMNLIFNFFDAYSIKIYANGVQEISKYFSREYFDYKCKNQKELPELGSIQIYKEIEVPKKSDVIIKNKLFFDNNKMYFKERGNVVCIEVRQSSYTISVECKFEPNIIFYIHEVLMRLYSTKYNLVFIHASAFLYKSQLFVINAFGGTGKTNLVLDAIEHNGQYFSDDLCVIDRNNNVYPYTKCINLLDYNFEHNPELVSLCGKSKFLFKTMKLLAKFNGHSPLYRYFIHKVEWRIKRYFCCKLQYEKIKSPQKMEVRKVVSRFIWLERTLGKSTTYSPQKQCVYSKMVHCLDLENRSYLDFYGYVKMCFPELSTLRKVQNEIIKDIVESNDILGFKKGSEREHNFFEYLKANS